MMIKIQHNKTNRTYTLSIDEVETKPMTERQVKNVLHCLRTSLENEPTLYMDIID